jgi:hypothetical protein
VLESDEFRDAARCATHQDRAFAQEILQQRIDRAEERADEIRERLVAVRDRFDRFFDDFFDGL